MKLSRDGKCVVIALSLRERVTVVQDHIAVVMNNTAYAIDRVEFDFLEAKQMIVITEAGCRITGRGRVWAKQWADELWGHDPQRKAIVAREKSLSRVRLRRGNRRSH